MQHPAHRAAVQAVLPPAVAADPAAIEATLRRLAHAPKLAALRDILSNCGIVSPSAAAADGEDGNGGGAADPDADSDSNGGGGGGHRVLIFAQHKALLDLIERDLMQPYGVSYLRLDGGVEANARFAIVQRFNSDPTIDVLLLTTGVGGVGLNLTSADTVVFMEHDWNPMRDMQVRGVRHVALALTVGRVPWINSCCTAALAPATLLPRGRCQLPPTV